MIEALVRSAYGLTIRDVRKAHAGAGSDTYFIECGGEKYVLKFPCDNAMNNPLLEPELCRFLLDRGISVSQFVQNRDGGYVSADEAGRIFHLQKFVEGKMYEWNAAPGWLLAQSAIMLGRIHRELKDYPRLPTGIGADFFRHMTPENALRSYRLSLEKARRSGDAPIIADLEYRIEQMMRLPRYDFRLDRLTCQSTHGDYFISQLICGDSAINAVIDWTTACVHPVVWELMRSYVYAAPCCAGGEIDIAGLLNYVKCYLSQAELGDYDIMMMAKLFYYQLAVCDYYGQYYNSTSGNRDIYLSQACLSTGLMRWFEKHIDELTDALWGELCKRTPRNITT